MKVQVHRVTDTPGIGTWGMDTGFINATMDRLPKVGEYVTVRFDRLGKGTWMSTLIREVKTRPGVKIFVTKNSEYHVKKGWTK